MKWLAQLKIQERGRAVALKEAAAAAVQQPEKRHTKKKNPHITSIPGHLCCTWKQDVVGWDERVLSK